MLEFDYAEFDLLLPNLSRPEPRGANAYLDGAM